MTSILTDIKKMLGIVEEYEQFDTDIMIHINSIISILTQIGVGPSEGYEITDKTALWTDWVGTVGYIGSIKTYIYLRVKLLFDPPVNSATIKSFEQIIRELEVRIMVATDPVLVILPVIEEV